MLPDQLCNNINLSLFSEFDGITKDIQQNLPRSQLIANQGSGYFISNSGGDA